MDTVDNGDGHFDLLTAALSESGLDNLEEFGADDGDDSHASAVSNQAAAVVARPLAQSTPARAVTPQVITVRTATPGPGGTALLTPTHSNVRVVQTSDPQRTPIRTKVIQIPSGAASSLLQSAGRSASPLAATQLQNGQVVVQRGVAAGKAGGAGRIIISCLANGNSGSSTPQTKNVIVSSQAGAVTPQTGRSFIVTTPQGTKSGGTATRRILVTPNGQALGPISSSNGQVVIGSVSQSPQLTARTLSQSPQLLQAAGGQQKLLLNQANGQLLCVTTTPLSTSSISQTTQSVHAVSTAQQSIQIIPSQSAGSLQSLARRAGKAGQLEQTRIVHAPVGQVKTITRTGSTSQLSVISQPGLSGGMVISASSAPSPGPPPTSLRHSPSLPLLPSEGSGSRSNSPVFGMGNIPTVVSQVNRSSIGGGGQMNKVNITGASMKDLWSDEQVRWRTYNHNSSSQRGRRINMEREDAEEESEELGHAETYAEYMPRKVERGLKHPDQVVESSSLSSVEPPDVDYQLSISEGVTDQGLLSALQVEAITYACQRHQTILPNGDRAGYLIGDGAGVGKGRTVAGIIFENYLLGRKRALWLSVSNDLKVDAERDLDDIGAKIKVYSLNKFKYAKIQSRENGGIKKGVIFVTYSSLIGESSQSHSKYDTRMKQLFKWCGKNFDGVIVFDECHKAKNLCPTGSSKPTKTGLAVMELQNRLPKARVVYASATGASEPKNMAYMTRLGLWGEGTPFREFSDFISAVEKRGVGAMELVAMDMKLRGMYIARQLSFKGVSFSIEEIPLDTDFKKVYDASVDLWMEARAMFQKAADLLQADHRMRKSMWGQFWSAHQRFFKYLCISAKVPHCVNLVREAIKGGKCVVIGLQSTGEARTQEMVEEQGGDLNDFVSTAKGVFQTLVEKHFPASDPRKTFEMMMGFGNGNGITNTVDSNLKRKRDEPVTTNKRAKVEESSDSDDSESSFSGFSDLDSDSDNSESDGGSVRFMYDSDDETFDKSPKKKKKAKPPKKKQKVKKKKKKAKNSGDEEDEYCDNMLANISYKKGSSLLGYNATNGENSQGTSSMEQAFRMKKELLTLVEQLGPRLPPNTLDHLIDELGGPDMVAEMTGRKGRVVQNDDGIQYESRSEMDVPLEILNLTEKERFMAGEKDIAIISEAASSGISLQADRRVQNQKRRVHITLELPWSADRAIQQFGRTHRSNQVSAPEYIFLISELAGERRFAATVAKRLESLGALTHGDRRATESRDLSRFNIDNRFGRTALEAVMKSVLNNNESIVEPPSSYKGEFYTDVKQALEGVGLMTRDDNTGLTSLEKDYQNISKFLNRLLGMPTALQNALFDYFNNTLSAIILEAKRSGRWDMGILDLGSGQEVVQRLETKVFVGNTATNKARTELSTIQVERGMAWGDAMNIWRKCKSLDEGFYISTQERSVKRTAIMVVYQGKNKKKERVYSVYRPNTGLQSRAETLEELKKKYKKVLPDEAEPRWKDQYVSSAHICTHAYWNGNCKKVSLGMPCEIGLRTRRYHVLSGSVLAVWTSVETVLASVPGANVSKMQIVRLKIGDGQKIVGSLIPSSCVPPLINVLTQNSARTFTHKHQETLQAAINGLTAPTLPSSSSTAALNGTVTTTSPAVKMEPDLESVQESGSFGSSRVPETMLSMPFIE